MGWSPIFRILVTFYLITEFVYRKPKWSVWSIGTTFMRWDGELVMKKRSYGRKVSFQRVKKIEKSALRSKMGSLRVLSKTKSLLKILRHHPPPSRPDSHLKSYVFDQNRKQKQKKNRENSIFHWNSPLWGGLIRLICPILEQS